MEFRRLKSIAAEFSDCTEPLISSGETRNPDSIVVLISINGRCFAINKNGEGLSEGCGGRGRGWVVLSVSITSRVTV